MGKVKANYSNIKQDTPSDCAGFIYITINLVNGKKYIGSKLLSGKKPEYYLGSSNCLYYAIQKYGIDMFQRVILEVVKNKENICEAEEYWLDYFPVGTSKCFYNIKNSGQGGDTFSNRTETDKNKTREKLRQLAIKSNKAAKIISEEVLEMNRQRLLTDNPMKSKTTEEIRAFNVQKKAVKVVFDDGRYFEFDGIKLAARELGIKESTMKNRYRKLKGKSVKGWLIDDL